MTGRNSTPAFLGLGGNIGDPAKAMAAALRALDTGDGIDIVRVSSLYRTPPWGKADQPDFLNAVTEIRTCLSPRALLEACLATERSLKRERRERWGPRLIDLDILLYGDERIAEDGLDIPHPRMLERAFVLVPLVEIAPDLVLQTQPIADHLARLDLSGIERVSHDGGWWKAARRDTTD